MSLQTVIDGAWEQRAELCPQKAPGAVREAVAHVVGELDAGRLRVAEKIDGAWTTHQWIKKAVLLSFRLADNVATGRSPGPRTVPLLRQGAHEVRALRRRGVRRAGVRVVPPAVARRGAYIARNVVLMPSYVNIGAYVDEGTMVDTWATVGSCAQIGSNVHLSGGVGIGGVLEPLQANPTIIEDNCFIGARSEVVEGVIVEENSVLGMGVFIGQSTKIYDRATGTVSYGRVPSGSVVVAGSLPSADRRLPPLLRSHRQAGGCADALEDEHQRAAAKLMRAPLPMAVQIKGPEDIAGMRVAGRLASELLDYLTPFVKPGISTAEIDKLAHDYMVDVQHTVPATLNYAPPGHSPYPASLCTSVNHVVCHGIPGDKQAQGRRHREHRRHRDQGWLPRRHQPHVLRGARVDPGEAPGRGDLRGDVEAASAP